MAVLTSLPPRYTRGEEIAHTATHGLGVLLSVLGLVAGLIALAKRGDPWSLTAMSVFGASLIVLYTASTLYHAVPSARWKTRLRKLDHASIFLLIAGTYTPFTLVNLRGPWGWSLFGVVWGVALAGVVLKAFFAGRFPVVSTLAYVALGWLVVVAAKPMMEHVPPTGLGWLLAGGLCYTGGVGFYVWRRLPYHHAVWHVFVLAGSVCHYFAVRASLA